VTVNIVEIVTHFFAGIRTKSLYMKGPQTYLRLDKTS